MMCHRWFQCADAHGFRAEDETSLYQEANTISTLFPVYVSMGAYDVLAFQSVNKVTMLIRLRERNSNS